jgi:hypothetical protein
VIEMPDLGRLESLRASVVPSAFETAQVVHKPSLLGIFNRTVLCAGPSRHGRLAIEVVWTRHVVIRAMSPDAFDRL